MKMNQGSIEVPEDKMLIKALSKIMSGKDPVNLVIESGTYFGTGTTQLIIQAWEKTKKKKKQDLIFFTIEMKKSAYNVAKKNLEHYPYIEVLHGVSVGIEEARKFIENDEILRKPEEYPDIYCDTTGDLVHYYLTELHCNMDPPPEHGEELLNKLINEYASGSKILFVLDSCGGIGFYEFQQVKRLMGDNEFYLLFDDIAHVKHFRTFAEVMDPVSDDTDKWRLLYENGRVCLAHWLGRKA